MKKQVITLFFVLWLSLVFFACSVSGNNPYNAPTYKRRQALPKMAQRTSNNIVIDVPVSAEVPDMDTQNPSETPDKNLSNETDETLEMMNTESRIHRMVAESRLELIASGMSPEYVDSHFQVTDMIDEDDEKRVVWTYTLGDYTIEVVDPVSWTLDEKEEITYSHGIRHELGSTRNIELVIPMKQAEEIMQDCLGEYTQVQFSFIARDIPGSASLWMIARSVELRSDPGHIWNMGYVNLETGVCEKETGGAIHAPLNE